MSKLDYRILDGGSATELSRLGYSVIDKDPLWSARLLFTEPDAIKQAHMNFLEAGSEVVVTATYQASVGGFCEHLGLTEEQAVQLIQRGVQLAKEASQSVSKSTGSVPGLVAGSVGPYGAALHDGSEYTGTYIEGMTNQELTEWHKPRIKALVDSGADIIAIETIPAQKEAEAVVGLLEEFPGAKAWVTFSCKDGQHTCHGEMLSDALASVQHSDRVIALGVNCTAPQHIAPLLSSIQHLNIQKPIIVKPNSGEEWEAGKGWYGRADTPLLSEMAPQWLELGARWLGGCCRIFPSDIADLKNKLSELYKRSDSR